MGYTTDFEGSFTLNPPINAAQVAYLTQFCETRRMRRDSEKASKLPDPLREAVGMPIGAEGEFFVGAGGFAGQDRSDDVTEYNSPPASQPGLWCHWQPSVDGASLAHDGGEKFYYYTEWLNYMIEKFFTPWGVTVSGRVKYQGEEVGDTGTVVIADGVAVQKKARSA